MSITLVRMAKKRPGDRHKTPQLNIRMHSSVRKQLEKLVDRNVSTLSAEITRAVLRYLEANNLWPPPGRKPD